MGPFVEVEDVYYAYPPVTPGGSSPSVLNGVTVSLEEGVCLALLGRTGAGKSTLCLTLNGIIPHLAGGSFRGRIQVAGLDTQACPPGQLSQTVGLVFQDPESQFFNMSVEDEVAFGAESLALPADQIEERVTDALRTTGIEDLRTRSPLELSGGEKQRVALAAVLVTRPKVLVLDEPEAGLDPAGRRSLLETVRRLRAERRTTVLWVTQDLDTVPLMADRVAVLDRGQIVLEGEVREVLAQTERMRSLGVGLPQMMELAERCNGAWEGGYAWLTVDDAAADLRKALDHRRRS